MSWAIQWTDSGHEQEPIDFMAFQRIPQPVGCSPTQRCSSNTTVITQNNEVLLVNTIADLAALSPYAGLKEVNVLGHLAVGDNAGGAWLYEPTSTATDDGYYTVTPAGGVGRFTRLI